MGEETSRAAATIIRPAGGIDIQTSPALRSELSALLDQRPTCVIIDLSAVTHLDSSGVGTLVEFKRRLERRGGKLILAELSAGVRGVIEVLKLAQFFSIVDRVSDATAHDP